MHSTRTRRQLARPRTGGYGILLGLIGWPMNACVLLSATGLLTITQEQYNVLRSLFFHIGGVRYSLHLRITDLTQVKYRSHMSSHRTRKSGLVL